jgi:hypothetical protein
MDSIIENSGGNYLRGATICNSFWFPWYRLREAQNVKPNFSRLLLTISKNIFLGITNCLFMLFYDATFFGTIIIIWRGELIQKQKGRKEWFELY